MRRDQKGMASIVVVSILIVIMTLISIGFARLMSRTVTTSANRAFSSAATYAAESGINDVSSYLKQYVQAHPGNLQPVSTQCTGSNSLIGSTGNPGPFYNDSNLAGNTDRSTQYTCILLNPTPGDLDYQQITAGKSQVVKLNTSAVTGALDKLMISWQADDTALTGFPPNVGQLNDETTWNDSSHHYIPLLRVTIYPVPVSNNLTNVQSDSRTVFLYPQQSSGNVPVQSYGSLKDGSIVPVGCTSTVGSGTFTGSADDKCNIIISDLAKALGDGSTADTQLNYAYLRLTPIYNQLDVKLKANDIAGQALSFVNDQAVVDVTAQTAGVAKRLQARVDTSSLGSSQGEDDNLSFNSNSFPEDSVRSANALCKRLVQTTSYFNYVSFDDPDNVCHDTNGNNNINSPQPTLTLSITGHTGPDDGKTVDSQANNPDSPQNPVQQGTVYINSGGSATLNWTSHDATHCIAGGGWSGDQAPSMSWSGTTGTGTQTFTGITSKTDYTLQCNRTGTDNRPSTTVSTPNLKVTAWPPPVITMSTPSTVEAGQTYTVSWSNPNGAAVRCVLSGNWPDLSPTSTSGSESYTWPSQDNYSTRTYTVTCYDPIGRSDTKTWSVSPNNPGNGQSGSGGDTKIVPPVCSATASFSGHTTSSASVTWSTHCDYYDDANICLGDRLIDTNIPNIPDGYASPCYYGSGSQRITQTGTYHFQIYVWAPPWRSQSDAAGYGSTNGSGEANSGQITLTVYNPLQITSFQGNQVWDQGPNVCAKNTADPGSYYCRNNQFVENRSNGCPDGVHQFTMCGSDLQWSTSGGYGAVICAAESFYGTFAEGGPSRGGGGGSYGWPWPNPEPTIYLICNDQSGDPPVTKHA